MGILAYLRLGRAGFVLAREGAFSLIDAKMLPGPAQVALGAIRLVERRAVKKTGRVERLTRALNKLGPTYVKFGQLLGTRPDIVGPQIAEDLSALQDRMDPFDARLVPGMLKDALGEKAAQLTKLSPPVAAASIAQVHKAEIIRADGSAQSVAVKVLRPDIAKRFRRDLESYYAGARLAEKLVPVLRRLKPVSIVEILDRSARLELDLRFEAASISEFAENIKDDTGFAVPEIKWEQVASNVLTTSWVDGVPIRDHVALDAAGIDKTKLAAHLMQSFLRHAIRDGFFHADMHPGNLFADPHSHGVIAVDFGIMGRITKKERRFLADILYGFITRDYKMIARRHFDIGYVPADQSVDDFALAIRSIGEPMHGRLAREISMAGVLGQLLAITELFDMQTRPELLLLQKTMVLVEGVARSLDPDLNIWDVSEPVVRDWLEQQVGPAGRIADIKEHIETTLQTFGQLPGLVVRANAALDDYEAQKARGSSNILGWLAGSALILVSLASVAFLWTLIL